MKLALEIGIILVACHFVSSCATTVSPMPGSEKIKIIASLKNNCKNLGEIYADDLSRKFDSSENTLHERNTILLKNKAHALGANKIVLTDHSFSQETRSIPKRRMRARYEVNVHSMSGIAYYCPK